MGGRQIVHRPGLDKYIGRIRDSALVITGRYHAVTMCLLTATPFLAVESSIPKISWLLEDAFGTGERVFRKVRDIGEDIDPRSHAWSGMSGLAWSIIWTSVRVRISG